VAAKVGLAALVSLGVGGGLALLFGIAIAVGDVEGGEPWPRLPLLAVGLVLAGAALGALGAFLGAVAREARSASLLAVLVVMPIIFLGLVPREVVPVAGWVSDALPFTHAVRFFGSALYDLRPWGPVLREGAWLAGLAAVFGAVARVGMRRLSS
jgi:ABC-2 type transport system permease protein